MFERNQAVNVTIFDIELEGTIAETGPMGRPMPFYPDSTVTKYGNGSNGRTAWGYKVRCPIVCSKTREVLLDRAGRPLIGIGYIEIQFISPL